MIAVSIGSFSFRVATALICIVFMAERGSCISCWECNSKYDPNCGEPFNSHTIAMTDCNQRFLSHHPEVPGKVCRKIVQKVRDDTRIIRSCGYLDEPGSGKCLMRAGTYQVFMQYCHCDNADGCNDAFRFAAPSFSYTIAGAILIALLARKI